MVFILLANLEIFCWRKMIVGYLNFFAPTNINIGYDVGCWLKVD